MKFSLEEINSQYLVSSYEPGCLVVGKEAFRHSMLLMPERLKEGWPVDGMARLRAADLESLTIHTPVLILLGTGEKQIFPAPEVLAPLIRAGIGCEIMSTSAACRTYNVLLSEERQVLAALIV